MLKGIGRRFSIPTGKQGRRRQTRAVLNLRVLFATGHVVRFQMDGTCRFGNANADALVPSVDLIGFED
ncbi:MAG: hypothetical protein CME05_15055 [Gemmatimonadaceae bacterium]|nr:hypothetical protein [Gemmatimonadaceae bacterium]